MKNMLGLFSIESTMKMLSVESAKKIGITYCAEQMGIEFVKAYADNSTTAFSEEKDNIFCFLGIDDSGKQIDMNQDLVLTNRTDLFPHRASCTVSLIDGTISDFIYIHP